ncbi:MAG: hypothetical protein ABL911_09815 [Gallionella sp.]|nr:hypothetical protein [Gallionella sp.]
MGMLFCRGCGVENQDGSKFCGGCGAAISEISGNTQSNKSNEDKTEFLSYEQVPWYRSHGFVVSSFFVFMPALLSIFFTGDVYYEKNESLKIYSKWTRVILILLGLLSTLLIAAQAFSFLGGGSLFGKMNLLDSKEVKIVKTGTLLMCPNHTLEKMAVSFMGSPSWESGKAKDGTSFVNVSGQITYSDKPVEAKVQFTIEGDSFSFRAFEMNNVPSANIIAISLLGKMCESAGGTVNNESSIKQVLFPVDTKPIPQIEESNPVQQQASLPDSTETRFGFLTVKKSAQDEYKKSIVLLPNTMLVEIEDDALSVERVYQIAGDDVVMIQRNCTGSGCSPSIAFITLRANGTHVASQWFYTNTGNTINPVKVGDKLIVDLGFDEGVQKTLTYENGETTVQRSVPAIPAIGEAGNPGACKWLYQDLYIPHIKEERCNQNPEDIGGRSTSRTYTSLSYDKHFNLDRFEKMARVDCENKLITTYEIFQQQICKR